MIELPPRESLIPPHLTPGAELLGRGADGTALGTSAFMTATGFPSEAAWKRGQSRIMQHAHIGFRSVERTLEGLREVHGRAAEQGVTVDRFGITLDWSMGYPHAMRATAGRGTGIVLTGPEDFARITEAVPAAMHFGDFMLGLPGGFENTRAAIAAGATALGNLGQYFTFRLPGWDDDVATTEATVQALGLIAAQGGRVLVHSNLDDGFAGLFRDMCCSLGMVIVEKRIVEDLCGAPLAHCHGHHFSDPLSRLAFHGALAQVSDTPGTMIYGNTVSYRGAPQANGASLAAYLLPDMMALGRWNTGHAVNPVPLTENLRIPDTDEIIEAQLFAHRLAEHAPAHAALIDWAAVEAQVTRLVTGGRAFAEALFRGLEARGIDLMDPAQLLLAIRRLGPRRLEQAFGPREAVPADWARALDGMADAWLDRVGPRRLTGLRVCIGTSDVHEHGKHLVERALAGLGAEPLEGGVSVDPERLVARAVETGAQVIAVSTYNGVARRYAAAVLAALDARGVTMPVLVGGKLNEVPDDTNSGLPVDVTAEIAALGAVPCADLDAMLAALEKV